VTASIFLLPNGTFFFELVIFILVLGAIAKFILPPIKNAIDERERTIRDALQASDEGQREADQLRAQRDEVLANARAEARSLLEAASRRVEEARAEARARATVEHDQILSRANAEIATERESVRQAVIGRLDQIVIAAAEQVIGSSVDGTSHRSIIEHAIASASSASGE
jgi:F-type H+-transporting ATPase subunit b